MDFIFDPSLVLYLPLYELGGSSFISKDKHGHPCTVTGALWRPDGHYFDGIDDKMTIPDADSLDLTSTATVEMWVNCSRLAVQEVLFGKSDGATYVSCEVTKTAADKISALFFDGGWKGATGATSLTAGNFYHIVCTFDLTNTRVHLNGSLDKTTAVAGPMLAGAGSVKVATYSWVDQDWFQGIIGEIRLYKRVLSPQEIQHNYLATKWRYQ